MRVGSFWVIIGVVEIGLGGCFGHAGSCWFTLAPSDPCCVEAPLHLSSGHGPAKFRVSPVSKKSISWAVSTLGTNSLQ